jgi:hypothetical protein
VGQVDKQAQAKAAADLRARIEATPTLPFAGVHFAAKPPAIGWESGAVSWVAFVGEGSIYEIQRGDKAVPVLVLDREGKVLRSWGKGDYKIPHSIRIDPEGNVWTESGTTVWATVNSENFEVATLKEQNIDEGTRAAIKLLFTRSSSYLLS